MLAMPTTRDIPYQTVMSLLETQGLLHAREVPAMVSMPYGCSTGAFDGRNKSAHQFLQSKCTHLFWVDSDTSWNPEDFWRILSLGSHYEFIAGCAPRRADPPKFPLRIKAKTLTLDQYGCVKVRSVGLAFACVQRKVMEQLAEKAPMVKQSEDADPQKFIFRCEPREGEMWGEDSLFCNDVSDLGYDINIDPKIVLGHIGPKEFKPGCLADTWKRVEA